MHIKKFKRLEIIAALLLAYTSASAQSMNVPTKFSTPRGNITVYQRVYMPHYQNYETVSNKHFFSIVLRNDSVITKKAKIVTKDSVHILSWSEKGEKKLITPVETKEIYRMEKGKKITGSPTDSCWLFPVESGAISTFSILSETYDPIISHIQKGSGGQILALTKENLLPMLSDNEKALKLVEKGKLLKAIDLYNKQ
jgi:hypothetical protein